MSKISVIVPVYNVEKYLECSLESILSQTYKDIELICINDCSTDKSLEILKVYANKDSRVKIINNEFNIGAGGSRNIGVKHSSGEYLTFVDPDDWIEKDRLAKMYDYAVLNNADIVETSFKIYKDYSRKIELCIFKNFISENTNLRNNSKYLLNYSFDPWCKLYKASLIKDNDIKFYKGNYGEVISFTFKARILAKKIFYLDSRDYIYRIRKGSSMQSENFSVVNIVPIMIDLQKFVLEQEVTNEFLRDFETYIFDNIVYAKNRIPKKLSEIYEEEVENLLGNDKYDEYLMFSVCEKTFKEKVFSIKNKYKYGLKYKILTILGIEIPIKRCFE